MDANATFGEDSQPTREWPPFGVQLAGAQMAVQPKARAWALAPSMRSARSLCSCIITTLALVALRYDKPDPHEETFVVAKCRTKSSSLGSWPPGLREQVSLWPGMMGNWPEGACETSYGPYEAWDPLERSAWPRQAGPPA